MSKAASFSQRWARDNLTREASREELVILDLFLHTCGGDEVEAGHRARRYYTARGPGGLTELWHHRQPDEEDILSSCQDAYIIPLKTRSVSGRRVTIIRLPAPSALDRPQSSKALLARWLMMMDIRLREDPAPSEEIVFIDVVDMQPSHVRTHVKGSYWRDFVWCMKAAYPTRFLEVHIINTHRIKSIPVLLLLLGLFSWRRKNIHIHTKIDSINHAMGLDYIPVEGLPYEYGGRAGGMKDLNDEWTKKLLSNSKWLQMEERKFYNTELKPEIRQKTKYRHARQRGNTGSYDMLTRTRSYDMLGYEEFDASAQGTYRIHNIAEFYV